MSTVVDAIGGTSEEARRIGLERVIQADVDKKEYKIGTVGSTGIPVLTADQMREGRAGDA